MNFTLDRINAMQIFQSLRFGGTLLVTILLARSYFSLSEIAHYEYYLFLMAILLIPLSIGINNAVLVSYKKLALADRSSFLNSAYVLLLSIGVVSGLLVYMLHSTIGIGIKDKLIALLSLLIVANLPNVLIDSMLLLKEKFSQIVYYSIFHFILQIGLLGVLLLLKLHFIYLLYYLIAFAGIKHLLLLWLLFDSSPLQIKFAHFKAIFYQALPLTGIALLSYGMETIDGILVKMHFEEEQFAIFRYGAKELPLTILLVSGMVTALIPIASQDINSTLRLIREKMDKLLPLLFGLSIFLILISPLLFTRVYGAQFEDSAYIFNVYLLTLSSRIVIPQVFYLSSGKNHFLFRLSIVELGINLLLSLLLLEYYGILGIAMATFVAYIIHKGLMIYYLKRDFDLSFGDLVNLPRYIVYNIFLYGAFIISYIIY